MAEAQNVTECNLRVLRDNAKGFVTDSNTKAIDYANFK